MSGTLDFDKVTSLSLWDVYCAIVKEIMDIQWAEVYDEVVFVSVVVLV